DVHIDETHSEEQQEAWRRSKTAISALLSSTSSHLDADALRLWHALPWIGFFRSGEHESQSGDVLSELGATATPADDDLPVASAPPGPTPAP
uniref:hypothetical protein n=1 Tax=Pseudomonas aeruginosa TaxID=287 RepID=UPI0020C506CB